MLASLELRNYRCFDRHQVCFRQMNVIVGANNAGKSTLVEALRLLGLVTSRYQGLTYQQPPAWTGLASRFRGTLPAMGDIDLRGGSVFHRYGSPPAIITACFKNGTKIEVYVGPENRIFGVLWDETGRAVISKSQAKQVVVPSIAILPQIGPLIENEPVLTEEYVSTSINTALASRHFRNQLYWLKEKYFASFRQIAEESWHRLHIESLELEGDSTDRTLNLHVRDTNFVAEVGWMGHGLQMWLQTMWFLSRSADAHTVILDEPDVYMHADLQRRLIRLLRNRPGQTVIATHSVEIMSEVNPEDILIVDKARTKSSFAAHLPAVQNAIDQIGGVHNIHLARLWGSQKCLHVEGKDVSLLKIFQDKLYPTSDAPFDIIPRLSIGGWSGWQYAIGSTMALKNSAGEAIAAYCILDSDYHTEDEIARRFEEAANHRVRLHIWKLKEIENYLLVPSAIARLISSGMVSNRVCSSAPSDKDVENKIEEIATDLKDTAFDALAQEYISKDRSGGLTLANQKARQRLEDAWKSQAGRFGLISGKLVLSKLSEWSKAQYGVSFGTLRIARELLQDEICSEIKSVVRAIERSQAFPTSITSKTSS